MARPAHPTLGSWRILLAVLLLTAGPRPLGAGEEEAAPGAGESRFLNEAYDPAFRARVNGAIARGVRWLRAQQAVDGSWPSAYGKAYPMGPTALAALTLLKAGVPRDDPAVERAFAHLRTLPLTKTYSVGVLLMALDARYAPARDAFAVETVDRYGRSVQKDPCLEQISKEDLAWMRAGVTFLLEHQTEDGAWRYPSKQQHDLSNTQYALLGLKAAMRCGIKIPADVWLRALTFLLRHQEASGQPVTYRANEVRGRYRIAWTEQAQARGFRYTKKPLPVSGSMTTAGLAGLVICQGELWSSRRFKGDLREQTRRGIRDALAWMQTWMEVRVNPLEPGPDVTLPPPPPMQGGPNHLYYLYGLERASMLGRIRLYGTRDWYEEGAELLLASQADEGHWAQDAPVVDTCFAILFLKRSTSSARDPVITPSGGSAGSPR